MDTIDGYEVDPTYPFDLVYHDKILLDNEIAVVLSVGYDEDEEIYIVRYETERFVDEDRFEETETLSKLLPKE